MKMSAVPIGENLGSLLFPQGLVAYVSNGVR